MKILSSEVRSLLEKLYNLRGEDSIVLTKMNKEREEAIATQERTRNEKTVLLTEIETLTEEEKKLADEGNKLLAALGNIHRDEFAFVLERLNLDFDPEALNAKVSKQLPETIDKVVNANQKASEKLENVENEMNNAITKIEELEIRKEEALSNQARLNDIFSLALSGNINITRDEITSLLDKFDFSDDEKREAAKILMFPEDALYQFDELYKNGNLRSRNYEEPKVEKTSPKEEAKPKAPAKETVQNVEAVKESVQEDPVIEDIFDQIVSDNVDPKELFTEEQEQPKEKLEKLLTSLDLNPLELSESAFNKLLENYDENTLKANVQVLKDNKFNMSIARQNIELLYDKELKDKIEKLLTIGKEVKDITLVPNVLIKYDLKGLNNTINVLQVSGLDPKKVPLMAY